MERAARIAVRETKASLEKNSALEKVLLVCFGQDAFEIHVKGLQT
jgi:hypothetical protein